MHTSLCHMLYIAVHKRLEVFQWTTNCNSNNWDSPINKGMDPYHNAIFRPCIGTQIYNQNLEEFKLLVKFCCISCSFKSSMKAL